MSGLARGDPIEPAAPLILIGGGAKGATWRDTIRRLSGRALLVPDTAELVALGAAAQAAAALTGEPAPDVARRWNTRRGNRYDPLPADSAALEKINATLDRARELLAAPTAAASP